MLLIVLRSVVEYTNQYRSTSRWNGSRRISLYINVQWVYVSIETKMSDSPSSQKKDHTFIHLWLAPTIFCITWWLLVTLPKCSMTNCPLGRFYRWTEDPSSIFKIAVYFYFMLWHPAYRFESSMTWHQYQCNNIMPMVGIMILPEQYNISCKSRCDLNLLFLIGRHKYSDGY